MKVKDFFLTGEIFEIQETETKGVLKTYPVPENLASYYNSEKYISHHQDAKTLKHRIYKFAQYFNFSYKKNILLSNLPKGATILDYGCGTGDFLRFIERDFVTIGFEPNEAARETAIRKLRSTQMLDNIENIPDGTIDAITLWHVFEHIENQEDILDFFHKKLKTNGLLVLALPNYESFDAKYYTSYWAAYDVPRHIYHFSKEGLKNLLKKNWTIQRIKPLLLDALYISIISEKNKKNPLFLLYGFVIGAISNFKALKSGDFSSLIFVIKKK